jgi:hypothetical protein
MSPSLLFDSPSGLEELTFYAAWKGKGPTLLSGPHDDWPSFAIVVLPESVLTQQSSNPWFTCDLGPTYDRDQVRKRARFSTS